MRKLRILIDYDRTPKREVTFHVDNLDAINFYKTKGMFLLEVHLFSIVYGVNRWKYVVCKVVIDLKHACGTSSKFILYFVWIKFTWNIKKMDIYEQWKKRFKYTFIAITTVLLLVSLYIFITTAYNCFWVVIVIWYDYCM